MCLARSNVKYLARPRGHRGRKHKSSRNVFYVGKVQCFIYASSSMVYGDFQSASADESHPTNPKEIYGTMKLAGENITLGLSRFYEIPSTIVRPSAVYGPTDMNRRVTQIFLEKAIDREVLEVQGADEALDFTYVKDIARGFVLAATMPSGAGQVLNIFSDATPQVIKWLVTNEFRRLIY